MSLRRRIFLYFASLKLAVLSLLSLSALLAYGTILESLYGARAAQVMVYQTWWFSGVLFFLGLNVLCAALSRYPWKKHQTGFVITHAGILIILVGSYLTQKWGVDGNLPVQEKTQSKSVFLSRSILSITDEDAKNKAVYTVPESGQRSERTLLTIGLPGNHQMIVDEYLPRASMERKIVASPLPGVGNPAIHVALANSRFNVENWMVNESPGKPTELPIGPAIISFEKLWSKKAEKDFFKQAPPPPAPKGLGYVVATFHGRKFRFPIKVGSKVTRNLGNENATISIDRYFSYAVVEGKDLINKSSEPKNPAVQLTIRTTNGRIEKHTVFSNFPQFPTRHGKGSLGPELGFKLRMISSAQEAQRSSMGIVGMNRGRLKIAQSQDNKKLFYKALSSKGEINGQGEITLGKEMPTGWMDIQFKITQWFPAAVRTEKPRYIDQISGGNANFLSAIRIRTESARNPASTLEEAYLMQGSARSFSIDGRRYIVRFGKEQLTLPFSLFLEKFTIGMDPGTTKAASYSSNVRVKEGNQMVKNSTLISMNEPLVHGGYTFYQASYQLPEGQPAISIFSVNWDPGRFLKYAGSLIMVLGIMLMFYMNPHYFDKIGLGVLKSKKREKK